MSRGELTTTSYALLNLLAARSWTTYELAKQMHRNYHWFWPRAESKLYEEPKKLVALGLATATTDMVGRRPRTTYAITPAGRGALAAWLASPGPPGPVLEFDGLVRVFAAPNGTLADLQATLRGIEQEMEQAAEFGRMISLELAETLGPFPERAHVNALIARFLWNYNELVRRWASWALAETAGWEDTSGEGKQEWAREVFALTPREPLDPAR